METSRSSHIAAELRYVEKENRILNTTGGGQGWRDEHFINSSLPPFSGYLASSGKPGSSQWGRGRPPVLPKPLLPFSLWSIDRISAVNSSKLLFAFLFFVIYPFKTFMCDWPAFFAPRGQITPGPAINATALITADGRGVPSNNSIRNLF